MRPQLVGTPAKLAAAIALLAAGVAHGQGAPAKPRTPATPMRLHGRVIDKKSKGAVAGAQVILDSDGRFVTSDSLGAYDFVGIPNGVVELTIRAQRFAVAHYALELIGTASWEQTIELDSTAAAAHVTRLAPVAVTAEAPEFNYRLQGFEIRRASGRGQYLTDAEIKKSGAVNIQDAVRDMRGVLLDCGGTQYGGCRIRMSRAPARCMPEYYVDGQKDDEFGPSTPIRDVIAIEVYTGPSDVPGDFAGSQSGCGVIALWTRSGPDKRPRPKEP